MVDHHIARTATTRSTIVSMGVVGVLLLGACGSSPSDAVATSGESGGVTSASRVSPLEDFMNPGGQPGATEDYVAKDKLVQERITTCMTAQGFDYIPFVYPTSSAFPEATESDSGSRDWAAKYGYGISTSDQAQASDTSGVTDPNQAIMEAMSPGEQQAYSDALYGGGMGVMAEASVEGAAAPPAEAATTAAESTEVASVEAADPTSDPVSIPEQTMETGTMSMADQGCWGQAQAEVYGDTGSGVDSPDVQAQFQGMWDAYQTMYNQIESDPRVTAATQAWKDCMATAGHSDLESAQAARDQVNSKWAELNGWDTGGMFEGGGMSSAVATEATAPSSPSADRVAAFKEYEIALALADWDCKASSKIDDVSDEVRVALEEKFLADHRAELEQFRDLMNSGR